MSDEKTVQKKDAKEERIAPVPQNRMVKSSEVTQREVFHRAARTEDILPKKENHRCD